MGVASFTPPTLEIFETLRSGRMTHAVRLWRELDHRLADGTPVVPTIRTASRFLLFIHSAPASVATSTALAISPGSYRVRTR